MWNTVPQIKLNQLYSIVRKKVEVFIKVKIQNKTLKRYEAMLKAKNKNKIKLNQNFDLMSSSECKCHKRCLLARVITKKLEL